MTGLTPNTSDLPLLGQDGADTVSVNVQRLALVWQHGCEEFVRAMALSPDHTTLAVGTADGCWQCLQAHTGTPITQAAQAQGLMAVTALAWSAEGTWLAIGGEGATLTLAQPATGHVQTVNLNKTGWVSVLQWHPSNPWLLVACQRQLHVWNAQTQQIMYQSPVFDKAITGACWHPVLADQLALVSGTGLHRLKITEQKPLRSFNWGAMLFGLHWSPDAKTLATATHDNALHVWNAKTGNDLHMSGYTARIAAMAWSCDGRFIATSGDQDVTIWDFAGKGPEGSMPVMLSAHEGRITQLAYCGAQLATGDEAGQVFIWLPPHTADWNTPETPLWAYPMGTGISQLCYPLADRVWVGTTEGQCALLATPG
jgi:WD40 repeat protein